MNWTNFNELLLNQDINGISDFIKSGFDIHSREPEYYGYGKTTLETAIEYSNGEKGLEIIKKLIANSPNSKIINLKDDKGVNSLFFTILVKNDLEILKTLIEMGADINSKTSYGFNLLHAAADTGNREILDYLLKEHDLDINSFGYETDRQRSPLMIASKFGHTAIIELLLDNGADPNLKSNTGETALQWALENKQNLSAKLLIERGAK